jgi:hypothetical protein
MTLGKFLIDYGWIILAIIVYFLYRYRTNKGKGQTTEEAIKVSLRETAFMAFLAAEKLPNVNGEARWKHALRVFYAKLPATARGAFTEESMDKYLQKRYYEFKDWLDDGAINKSIEYPPETDVKIYNPSEAQDELPPNTEAVKEKDQA